ncbi:DNA helicase, partial [Tanacetum coccineum]
MEQYPDLTPADRADVVCRVFKQKVNDFLSFLKEVKTFGDVSFFYVLYTIEFRKRGLPHCHTLLWVDSKNEMQDAHKIDNCISGKIPDSVQDPRGYKLVTELMMHGPCGAASSSAACMQKGSCSKHFPKTYNDRTFFDNDSNAYTIIEEGNMGSVMRGPFKCPYEACWRIFDFLVHSREPAVQMLNVHLENMQRVTFRESDKLDIIVNLPEKKKTTLTEWFVYNNEKTYGRHLTYLVFLQNLFGTRIQNDGSEDKSEQKILKEGLLMFIQVRVTFSTSGCCYVIGKDDPPQHLLRDLHNKLLMEEKNYKRDLLREEAAESELLFVYGHGGTGKTFLWRTITSSLRSHGKIVLAIALSGIASLLLPAGRTAHSRFKLPLELTDESLCHAKNKSRLGNLLVEIDLIIWDEAPMNDKCCFET